MLKVSHEVCSKFGTATCPVVEWLLTASEIKIEIRAQIRKRFFIFGMVVRNILIPLHMYRLILVCEFYQIQDKDQQPGTRFPVTIVLFDKIFKFAKYLLSAGTSKLGAKMIDEVRMSTIIFDLCV